VIVDTDLMLQSAHFLNHRHLQHKHPSTADWYIDSDATHHVTSDLNNLTNYVPYDDNDTLHIGNGTDMKILSIRSSPLSIANTSILLQDILHVPLSTKNLLNLLKLLYDNNLLFEFSSNYCLIKDHHTSTILLHAKLHNGLHILPFPPSTSPQVFLSERVPANVWHMRFGHPSSSTTLLVLNTYTLPCS
jgi:hypothetical protein